MSVSGCSCFSAKKKEPKKKLVAAPWSLYVQWFCNACDSRPSRGDMSTPTFRLSFKKIAGKQLRQNQGRTAGRSGCLKALGMCLKLRNERTIVGAITPACGSALMGDEPMCAKPFAG
jgi:hypothetical protein